MSNPNTAYYHAFDPAQDGKSDLIAEPAFPKLSISGPSWQDAFYRDLLRSTETMLNDYRRAVEDPSRDIEAPRQAMREGFLKNALKIAQTIERGHVADEDWQAFRAARIVREADNARKMERAA